MIQLCPQLAPKLVYVEDLLKNICNTILHAVDGKIINWCFRDERVVKDKDAQEEGDQAWEHASHILQHLTELW